MTLWTNPSKKFQHTHEILVQVCTAMGCAAGLSTKPMTGAELRRVAIPGTLTLAWRLGRAVARAHDAKSDPVQAVVQAGQGALLFSGAMLFRGPVIGCATDADLYLAWPHVGGVQIKSCRATAVCAAGFSGEVTRG